MPMTLYAPADVLTVSKWVNVARLLASQAKHFRLRLALLRLPRKCPRDRSRST